MPPTALARLAALAAVTLLTLQACAPLPPAGETPPAAPARLPVDGTWYWAGTLGGNGLTSPESPTRTSSIDFGPDGALVVRADCNTGRSRYTLDGRSLQLAPIAITKAVCGAGSTGTVFVSQLQAATGARVADGVLPAPLTTNCG